MKLILLGVVAPFIWGLCYGYSVVRIWNSMLCNAQRVLATAMAGMIWILGLAIIGAFI